MVPSTMILEVCMPEFSYLPGFTLTDHSPSKFAANTLASKLTCRKSPRIDSLRKKVLTVKITTALITRFWRDSSLPLWSINANFKAVFMVRSKLHMPNSVLNLRLRGEFGFGHLVALPILCVISSLKLSLEFQIVVIKIFCLLRAGDEI